MTNEDWAAAEDEYMRAERERLGGPPTPEEVVALLRGELSQAEAARLRALCVYYPELTNVLLEAAPVTESASAQDGEKERKSWRSVLPLAAMLAIGFVVGFLVQTRSSKGPRTFSVPHELHPISIRRGAAQEMRPHSLSAGESEYLLLLMLAQEKDFSEYRIELIDVETTPPETVWSSSAVHHVRGRPLAIVVPRTFLNPGTYRLELYGPDGTAQHVASYAVRVLP